MASRPLVITEAKLLPLEQQLIIAHWAIKWFACYTLFLPSIKVILLDAADCVAIKGGRLTMNIQEYMAKLHVVANISHDMEQGASILQEKALHTVYAQPDEEVERLLAEKLNSGGDPADGIWPHPGDYTLGGTARAGDEEKAIESRSLPSLTKAVHVYFDGGH